MTKTITYLADIPAAQAEARGDRIAVRCEDRTLTFAELDHRSQQVAALLVEAGVKPGDRVAWLGRAGESWYEIFFGAARMGACLAPINSRLAAPEIAYILQDTGAEIFFVSQEFYDTARKVLTEVEREVRVIGIGAAAPDFEPYAALRDQPRSFTERTPLPDDDVLQLYTSGTTGRPKGVRLSNTNYAGFLKLRREVPAFDYGPEEVVLIVMPLFHVAGTNISFAGLAGGGGLILLPDFTPPEVLRLIETYKVAHIFLAPAMIAMLLQSPQIETTDLSSMKTVAYGASPISEAVLTAATARFGCGFIQFYGMTESAGAGTFLAPDEHRGELLRSCGRAWKGLEVEILDEDGTIAAPGEIGEIGIRGAMVMAGYWNLPQATADTVTADGWLRTGDAGYANAEGFIFVHDRLKDMIVSGAENIYPAEVENAILGCPGVADAAVIGVPDERWGEAVKAIIVAAPGAKPDPAAVIAWARERIAGYKAPKSVDFIDVLPRNPSGKVLRRELRKPYWEGKDRLVG